MNEQQVFIGKNRIPAYTLGWIGKGPAPWNTQTHVRVLIPYADGREVVGNRARTVIVAKEIVQYDD